MSPPFRDLVCRSPPTITLPVKALEAAPSCGTTPVSIPMVVLEEPSKLRADIPVECVKLPGVEATEIPEEPTEIVAPFVFILIVFAAELL